MAEKEKETKVVLEREYTIPLRKEWLKLPKYRRAPKAVKAIKEFLAKHMKIDERDIKKVKIDKWLNNELWFRGIRKPPAKIKVKSKKLDNGIVTVELAEIPKVLSYKIVKEKKQMETAEKEKKEEQAKAEEAKKEEKKLEEKIEEEKKIEEKAEEVKEKKEKEVEEKKEAVVEAGLKKAEIKHREIKHEVGGKVKGPKHKFRQALQK